MTKTAKMKAAQKPPEKVLWSVADSPAGRLAVGLDEEGALCRVSFLRGRKPAEAVAEWRAEWKDTVFAPGPAVADLAALPVRLTGTKFQQEVWRLMTRIPAGKTLSYGEIARRVGKPGAARAVGAACGANPVVYIVPCHRVVAAGGGLGGFSGGLDVKEKLLKAEGWL